VVTTLTADELIGVFVETRPTLERVLTQRLGCRQTAQDVAQDLYFKIYRIAEKFPTHDDARRYLLRMAINAAIDHHRIEGRRAELLAGIAELFDDPRDVIEDAVVAKDLMNVVEDALCELPAKCRDVLYMSRIEGMTHAEIARKLRVSQSLVEKYAVRALVHCRARLLQN
jgi:RNA polymerase sigma factor (sigma-70 family)